MTTGDALIQINKKDIPSDTVCDLEHRQLKKNANKISAIIGA